MKKFSYTILDFLEEKELGLKEWIWLIIALLYGFTNGLWIYIVLSVYPAYIFARWKRKQLFNSGIEEWKSLRGILIGANAALILFAGSIFVLITTVYEKFGGKL